MADAVVLADPTETSPSLLELFLSSLKVLWQNGEARLTAVDKAPRKRERRRPDPLLQVIDQLKSWFKDEPWRTGRELSEKLEAEQPDIYPDGLLRTIQRRLKGWRTNQRERWCSATYPGSPAPRQPARKPSFRPMQWQ